MTNFLTLKDALSEMERMVSTPAFMVPHMRQTYALTEVHIARIKAAVRMRREKAQQNLRLDEPAQQDALKEHAVRQDWPKSFDSKDEERLRNRNASLLGRNALLWAIEICLDENNYISPGDFKVSTYNKYKKDSKQLPLVAMQLQQTEEKLNEAEQELQNRRDAYDRMEADHAKQARAQEESMNRANADLLRVDGNLARDTIILQQQAYRQRLEIIKTRNAEQNELSGSHLPVTDEALRAQFGDGACLTDLSTPGNGKEK